MPKKLIHRLLPDISKVLERSSMKWARTIARDPNLLHINRQSVSLAVAIGVFCAFMPVPGQTILAISLCYFLRANLPLGVVVIWISNPLTIPPMFYLTHQFGAFLLGSDPVALTVEINWQWFKSLGGDVLMPLFLGSIICGLFLAAVSYFIVLSAWRWRVIKNWEQRNRSRAIN